MIFKESMQAPPLGSVVAPVPKIVKDSKSSRSLQMSVKSIEKRSYKIALIVSSKARIEERRIYLIQAPVFNKQLRKIASLIWRMKGFKVQNSRTSMHACKNISISADFDYLKAGLASLLVLKKLMRKQLTLLWLRQTRINTKTSPHFDSSIFKFEL